jgi:6-phosphogluconolactonase
MAVDLPGRFLFTANMYDDTVSAYRIDSNGVLTHLAESSVGSMPKSLAVDPFGRFLYVTNLDGTGIPELGGTVGHVSAYHIGVNGTLKPVLGSPFPAGFSPLSVMADPSGQFVYVANAGSQRISTETISGYRVRPDGVLKPLPLSPFPEGGGSECAVVDPLGRFIYLANFDDPPLSAYKIRTNGILTSLPVAPANDSSSYITVDPLGRFVYENSATRRLWAYRIAANGVLISLPSSPFAFGAGAMVADLSGQFLYVGNGTAVSAYRMLGDGTLTPITGSPFQLGFSPDSVVVSP